MLYVAKFAEAVYVLHTFGKKTQRTSLSDLELAAKLYEETDEVAVLTPRAELLRVKTRVVRGIQTRCTAGTPAIYQRMMPASPKLNSQLAYEKIVELLLTTSLSEDSFLSERNLSTVVGLGRTPIREAVRDLVREGVLESHPTRGTIVRPLSIHDLQDLYEIRGSIEGLGAALAAERGRVEELEPFAGEFEKVLRDPAEPDLAKVHDRGVEFHSEIMRVSGNARLLELYRPFRLRFRICFGIVPRRTPDRVLTSVREHQAILNAIVRRDSEEARRLMCEHLKDGLNFRISLLLNRFQPG